MMHAGNLHLSKKFGALVAVDDVSFTVPAGEVLGFLGPNGAGKSTTMKMITGFLAPSAGTAIVCGHDIQREPLGGEAADRLPAGRRPGLSRYERRRVPRLHRPYPRVSRRRGAASGSPHIAELINIARRAAPADRDLVERLSAAGRGGAGAAARSRVLILDEPTDGLDPNQKHEMRGIIQSDEPR